MNVERLSDLEINKKGFAFDVRTGSTFSVNATGVVILQAMKDGLESAAIVRKLTEQFDVDHKTACRDLESFVGQLERNKFVRTEVLV